MMHAYRHAGAGLARLAEGEPLSEAIWIDLHCPRDAEVAAVRALGVDVPTLPDMEEIEISSRLYREGDVDYMTVVLPGLSGTSAATSGPATFIVGRERLVTVRHHAPRPFETYPERADRVGQGCTDPDRVTVSLFEEIVDRLADILESCGRVLDDVARSVYSEGADPEGARLHGALRKLGRENEQIGRVRLALLTLERAIGYFGLSLEPRAKTNGLRPAIKGLLRDIKSLEVHADYLASRLSMTTDATLGMINLRQSQTTKIVSVVAVVFLPPTLIASVYGMNFEAMPELGWRLGYPGALLLMLASAAGAYLFFRWKKWL